MHNSHLLGSEHAAAQSSSFSECNPTFFFGGGPVGWNTRSASITVNSRHLGRCTSSAKGCQKRQTPTRFPCFPNGASLHQHSVIRIISLGSTKSTGNYIRIRNLLKVVVNNYHENFVSEIIYHYHQWSSPASPLFEVFSKTSDIIDPTIPERPKPPSSSTSQLKALVTLWLKRLCSVGP